MKSSVALPTASDLSLQMSLTRISKVTPCVSFLKISGCLRGSSEECLSEEQISKQYIDHEDERG